MLKSRITEFLADEEGASAIEYALLAAMVAVAVAFFVQPINLAIRDIFQNIQDALAPPAP